MSIFTKLTNSIGETITFYSYKGGNGRTMALSNVATLLAQQNPKDKILVIDWDLEAPGLHRFFFQDSLFSTFTNDERDKLYKKVDEKPGLIDLFITLRNMIDEYRMLNENKLIVDSSVTKILDNLKLEDFILSTSFNNLHILKAGCFDIHYPDKVNTFNWEELYNKAPSLIRLFSAKLTKKYKYVLIDSRTGFTDISGICTMLMPQKLVVVFTPNRQSYTGIKELIIKATTYRRKSNDFRPLLVFPLPSRIEFSRDDLRAYWRYGNPEKRIPGYQNIFQDIFKDVYGLDECNLTDYFEQVQIQQSPNYAYGEEIAIISEKTKDTFSLSKSYEIFTQWLVDSNAPWQSKQDEESSNVDTSAAIDFDNLGLDFEKKGEFEKALSYYNRSLKLYEDLSDKKGIAHIHNRIGTLLKNMERYDDAIIHFEKTLEIHLNIKDNLQAARDCANIGSIFEKRSEYDKALKLYNEALKLYPNFTEALDAKRLLNLKMSKVSIKRDSAYRKKSQTHAKNIFISYAHEDIEVANRLFNELKEFDDPDDPHLELFLDKKRIMPGQKWRDIIENAIKESQYFIILLSKNSIDKNYVQEELLFASDIAKELPGLEIYIIPIRLDECQIPEEIQDLHIVDFFPDWKVGFEVLLHALGIKKHQILPKHYWESLLTAIDQKKCIPLIGESALEYFNQIDDKSFFTYNELAKEWAEKYNYPFEGPFQLPKIAQFLAIQEGGEIFPKANISDILEQIKKPDFSNEIYKNSPHAILAQLDLPIYITTNYDHFMEDALESQGKEPFTEICRWNDELVKATENELIPSVFAKSNRHYKPTPSKPLVFHFFGSFKYPGSMVLTESDHSDFVIYTNREKEQNIFPPFLRQALISSSLLFIGYYLENISFLSLHQGALSFMSTVPRVKNNIAVMQKPSNENDILKNEEKIKYLKKNMANMFKMIVYFGDTNEFIEELLDKWKTFKNFGSL